jgi:hypothetical protein
MNKPQKFGLLAFLIGVIFIPLTFSTTGCSSEPDPELLIRLDSLDNQLAKTSEFFELDFVVIDNRRRQMLAQENFVRRHFKGTMSKELGDNMSRYRSIFKVYRRFVNKYDEVKDEYEALLEQAKNLRTDVEANKIKKADFKKFYAQEKKDIQKNYDETKFIAGNINTLEPDYQRLRAFMDELLRQMAEEQPDLKGAVQDIENMFEKPKE